MVRIQTGNKLDVIVEGAKGFPERVAGLKPWDASRVDADGVIPLNDPEGLLSVLAEQMGFRLTKG